MTASAAVLDPAAPRLRVLTTSLVLRPLGGIELCMLQDIGALVARGHQFDLLYTFGGEQRATYRSMGVRVRGPHGFTVGLPFAPLQLLGFVPSIVRAMRSRSDVLWLNRSEQAIWAQLAARAARLPIVVHLHHAPNFRATRTVMTGVARFVAVSHYTKSLWVAAGIDADRITVVHNAVPLDSYPAGGADRLEPARRDLGLDVAPGARVVLYYGRPEASKGVLTLVRAWARLGLDPSRAVLVIAGPRPEGAVAKALAELPEGTWRLLGVQSDVVPLLHAADVVVMPSEVPEAFGRVLIEAMSTGRPVVGTDVGAIPEVLGGEFSRFVVPVADPEALGDALVGLLDWRDDDPELGARCRAWVEAEFPFDSHVDGVEAVLREHARPRRRRGRG
ncbi:glycosyltransferase involved in cell wall biosynthesis [Frigoribacterium sp. PhB160]|uniref:glycosyltransferase family 4 protein n=1 Tax=Frigoribacterium sp. PhB160 TaxID=2485192 RepID=UPI000F46B730|nr:glycosyltransferase family 4 protein [Frigoribacterium sp. PhB160]ROS61550.1 glycosyltransferase involved in cell wall biosynthesis [Frigoribacterium sp. PhB160]